MKSALKVKNEITKEYKMFYIKPVNSIRDPFWTVMLKEVCVCVYLSISHGVYLSFELWKLDKFLG